ncbi:MAG: lysophospholipid acyltransferase family protein [Desulfobacterales bacterium]|nr:lysophospholipid acyltransferase family protein [Desulfobacterales bacterium]
MTSIKLRDMLIEFKWKLIGFFGKLIFDMIFCTLRIESVGFEKVRNLFESKRFIAGAWHSRLLMGIHLHRNMGAATLVSQSDDGEIAARILKRLGNQPVRGSTTRGGLRALAQLIKIVKEEGRPAAITPDGPQGPRFKVQPGIIMLAGKTGYPIIPVTYSAKKMKVFASWDRFIFPYPFTTCRVIYSDPIYISKDTDVSQERETLLQLEAELNKITTEADEYFGHKIK